MCKLLPNHNINWQYQVHSSTWWHKSLLVGDLPPGSKSVCRGCVFLFCVILAADVSSTVPLRRSSKGELLTVVILKWESNHFLGKQFHPYSCFPPAQISFSPWEKCASKIFTPNFFPLYFQLSLHYLLHASNHLCFFPLCPPWSL